MLETKVWDPYENILLNWLQWTENFKELFWVILLAYWISVFDNKQDQAGCGGICYVCGAAELEFQLCIVCPHSGFDDFL